MVTPDDGLTVSIDGGRPLSSQGADVMTFTGYTRHGGLFTYDVVTDFAYAVPPGQHSVQIGAPGCTATTAPVEIPPGVPLALDGRLNPVKELRGPVDAPDGLIVGLGVFHTSVPRAVGSGTASGFAGVPFGGYSLSASSATGALLTIGTERRFFTVRTDFGFGEGSYSGQVTSSGQGTTPAAGTSYPMTGTMLVFPIDLRVGLRLPFRYVAPAIGSGIEGWIWFPRDPTYSPVPPGPFGSTPTLPPTGSVDIPIWASVEVKPFCNYGLEIGGSHNFELNLGASTNVLRVGLFYQPTSACDSESYLRVAGH
jgi:hypothetical protein